VRALDFSTLFRNFVNKDGTFRSILTIFLGSVLASVPFWPTPPVNPSSKVIKKGSNGKNDVTIILQTMYPSSMTSLLERDFFNEWLPGCGKLSKAAVSFGFTISERIFL
jgi:hypothetical protein